MPMANPWATGRTDTDVSQPPAVAVQQTNAYAVPPLSAGDAYNDEFGWAARLAQRTSTVEVPSAQRMMTTPRRDFRPLPERPPEEWWDRVNADTTQRESVVETNATGWQTPAGINPGDQRWAYNPRLHPPAESRPTNRLGPNTWTQTRPFDRGAKRFNGMHFSMADHRRKYDILGMRPATSRRNTYRIEPAPWDLDVVDLPPNNGQETPQAAIRSVEIPMGTRAMRLS
jgi:hypothetical protein